MAQLISPFPTFSYSTWQARKLLVQILQHLYLCQRKFYVVQWYLVCAERTLYGREKFVKIQTIFCGNCASTAQYYILPQQILSILAVLEAGLQLVHASVVQITPARILID